MLSRNFDIERYPGTNLKMNTVEVKPRGLDIHKYNAESGAPDHIVRQGLDE